MIKTILLKKLSVEGFKCYKERKEEELNFSTIFVGGNGKGKTSIADAITWIITGKLYSGTKQVENRFLNEDSNKAVGEVIFEDESGVERKIKRTFTEASGVSVWLDGKKISQKTLSEHIDIDTFLLTFNPISFLTKKPAEAKGLVLKCIDLNSINNESILADMVETDKKGLGGVNLDDLDNELKKIRKEISQGETNVLLNEGYILKAESEVKAIEIKELLSIDNKKLEKAEEEMKEIISQKPDFSNYTAVLTKKGELEKQIAEIKSKPFDNSKIIQLENEKTLLLRDIKDTENLPYTPKRMLRLEEEIAGYNKDIQVLKSQNSIMKNKITEIRKKYSLKVGSQCPVCKQNITPETVGNLTKFVNAETNVYMKNGVKNKNRIESLEEKVELLLEHIKDLKNEETEKEKNFKENKTKKINMLNEKISKINTQLSALQEEKAKFTEESSAKIKELNEQIDSLPIIDLKKEMDEYEREIEAQQGVINSIKEQFDKVEQENRNIKSQEVLKDSLKNEIKLYEKKISDFKKEIDKLNKSVLSINKFNQTKIRLIEMNIKKYFNNVSIRIEEMNEATGELNPCFKVLYNNKPVETCSLSEQVKASIEITEMIQNSMGLSYPIFLDNNESVSRIKGIGRQLLRAIVVDIPTVSTIEESKLLEAQEASKDIILKAC